MSEICEHCEGEMDAFGGVHMKDCSNAQPTGSPTPEEKVDHAFVAQKLLEFAETRGDLPVGQEAVSRAAVFAQLAIVDELRGVREALEGLGGPEIKDTLIWQINEVAYAWKWAVPNA